MRDAPARVEHVSRRLHNAGRQSYNMPKMRQRAAAVTGGAGLNREVELRSGHRRFRLLTSVLATASVLFANVPAPLYAQTTVAATSDAAAPAGYSLEQLDALMAPIALYPDELLTHVLMACSYPLEIVEAARWVEDPANKGLTGDKLVNALTPKPWDPAVKALVPFPQALTMMNSQLDWMQQVGYAMQVQQSAVLESVQRLRRQAQIQGQLKTTEQQVVRSEGQTIIIAPAQPSVLYVPMYNPAVVYGSWPYPSYPPVYWPPPPGYAFGSALLTGMAFGAGIAITSSLWGWGSPNWGRGNVNVNVNRYNQINVNRPPINNGNWQPRPPAGGGGYRPPNCGPVGRPGGPGGLPPNSVGRPGVSVPGNVVRPPSNAGPGNGANRPPINPGNGGGNRAPGTPGNGNAGANRPAINPGNGNAGANRPAINPGNGNAGANRPAINPGNGNAGANRPSGGNAGGANRPSQQPSQQPAQRARPQTGALSGMGDGKAAGQYGNRGAQSRAAEGPRQSGGGGGRMPQQGGRAR